MALDDNMNSKKVFRRSDGYDPVDLLRYAVDHREAALYLFKAAFEFHDSAAYLAHASVELLLKSLLLHATNEFPGGHGLRNLERSLRSADIDLELTPSVRDDLALLDEAWDVRYPHPQSPKQVGHSHRDALRSVWNHLASRIPSDVRLALEAAPPNIKGGRILMLKMSTS